MKKTKLLGILLAGAMSVTGIPCTALPLTTVASAESLLPAPKVSVNYVSSDYASLHWDVIKGADTYRVLKYNSKSDKYETFTETRSNDCHISGLAPKTKYKFIVVALKTSGNNSAEQTRSEVITVTTKGLAAPSSVSVSVTSDSATLSWSSSYNVDTYRVYKYSSKKGKFVRYKDVKGISCTIDGLKEGNTYKFQIASLAESDGKYSVQEKSPVITVSPMKSKPFEIPEFPKYGVTGAEALKFMSASYYTVRNYNYGGTAFIIGGVDAVELMTGDITTLYVDENDKFYGAMMMKATMSSDKEILAALKKKNGEPKIVKDNNSDMYIWMTDDEIKLAMFQRGTLAYIGLSRKYAPKEMLNELGEALKKTKEASSAV